jgi:hypothetical protein
MALKSYNRFKYTDLITTRNGNETYGLMSGFNDLKNITDENYIKWTVESDYEGRPDMIANKFYRTPYYEWIVVFANRPKNPLNWPKTGDIIKIPSDQFVKKLV